MAVSALAAMAIVAIAVLIPSRDDSASGGNETVRKIAGHPRKGALLLDEQFDGTALDATHWSPCYHWTTSGCTNLSNHELEWYVPEQVKVADGVLSLEARPQVVTGHEGRQFDYVSGLISGLSPAGALFSFQYGYVEARIQLPKGRGLWPALWMLPTTGDPLPEVDIFETVGEKPNDVQMHTHWLDGGSEQHSASTFHAAGLTKGWHTVGLDWKPDSLTWYVDGVARWRVTNPAEIPQESMYLIANLAVGGQFTTPPDENTPFPSSLKLDYLKVWKNA